MKKPGVFLSSTFYDLRQIREDLRRFIEDQLGYDALVSEMPSFPVDPDTDTIENCRRRVQDSADLLVLIIGGRYGSAAGSLPKSVTNMEYSTAKAKGIPIYAFVEKQVLASLPIWQDNPQADFSSVVDNVLVFQFVSEVRAQDRVWTFPFETAQHIIEVLRNQLAFLMSKGLELQTRLRGDPAEYKALSGSALRLAIDRPSGWQGTLFAHLLMDEIEQARDLKRAYQTGIYFGPGQNVPGLEALSWMSAKISEVSRLAQGITRLVDQVLNEALASSAIQDIAYGAREVARCYRECLNWAIDIKKASVDVDFVGLRDELSLMTSDIIGHIEALGPRLETAIDSVVADTSREDAIVNLDFVISVPSVDAFNRELERVKSLYGG